MGQHRGQRRVGQQEADPDGARVQRLDFLDHARRAPDQAAGAAMLGLGAWAALGRMTRSRLSTTCWADSTVPS